MTPAEQNDRAPKRLVPDEPFPPYAFVPGRCPHPRSNPAGHSFGVQSPAPSPLEPDSWETNRTYLYGIDLFNAGYYWEAHEAWESLWHAAGRRGPIADFLKGLIKLAAAGVKHREGWPRGVQSHTARAAQLWRGVTGEIGQPEQPFLGFRLVTVIKVAELVLRSGWSDPYLRPERTLQ